MPVADVDTIGELSFAASGVVDASVVVVAPLSFAGDRSICGEDVAAGGVVVLMGSAS